MYFKRDFVVGANKEGTCSLLLFSWILIDPRMIPLFKLSKMVDGTV